MGKEKKSGTKNVGASGNYEYQSEINPEAEFHSVKNNIYKKFKDLTDANIEKIIASGSKAFSKKAKATAPKEK